MNMNTKNIPIFPDYLLETRNPELMSDTIEPMATMSARVSSWVRLERKGIQYKTLVVMEGQFTVKTNDPSNAKGLLTQTANLIMRFNEIAYRQKHLAIVSKDNIYTEKELEIRHDIKGSVFIEDHIQLSDKELFLLNTRM